MTAPMTVTISEDAKNWADQFSNLPIFERVQHLEKIKPSVRDIKVKRMVLELLVYYYQELMETSYEELKAMR